MRIKELIRNISLVIVTWNSIIALISFIWMISIWQDNRTACVNWQQAWLGKLKCLILASIMTFTWYSLGFSLYVSHIFKPLSVSCWSFFQNVRTFWGNITLTLSHRFYFVVSFKFKSNEILNVNKVQCSCFFFKGWKLFFFLCIYCSACHCIIFLS